MQSVASMEIQEAEVLFQFLKGKSFPAELRVIADKSGLQMGELTVADGDYEHACDVVEAWHAERRAAEERMSRSRCPRCGYRYARLVARDTGGYTFSCKRCGCDYGAYDPDS